MGAPVDQIAKKLLGHSKNGVAVYVDMVGSHAATHLADTPELRQLVEEILADTVLEQDMVEFAQDMGRVVGTSDLVEIDSGDKLIYAKRQNRDTYTVFTTSRAPQPCSTVSVSFRKQRDGTYDLFSAWIGPIDSPPFPGDPNETLASKPFWNSHALVWGRQAIQPGTRTTTCPW